MGLRLYLNIFGIVSAVIAVGFYLYPELDEHLHSAIGPFLQYSGLLLKTSPNEPTIDTIAAAYRKGCPDHRFGSISILSRSPQLLIIENFVTPVEAEFLIKTAYTLPPPTANFSEPLFGKSEVVQGFKSTKKQRDSWSAYLNIPSNITDTDIVVNCIEQRARTFQGFPPVENMEPLQVVKYTDNGQFREHYDWLPAHVPSIAKSGNRLTSYFVYLRAECRGGTTIFPRLERPKGREWCKLLKCRDDKGKSQAVVEVRPKVGRAVFWYNLEINGEVDMNTLHAGTPVLNGSKFGLNIWTRQRGWRNQAFGN